MIATAEKSKARIEVETMAMDLYVRIPDLSTLRFEHLTLSNKQAVYTYFGSYKGNNSFLLSVKSQITPFKPMISQSQMVCVARSIVQNFTKWLRDSHYIVQLNDAGDPQLVKLDAVDIAPVMPVETPKTSIKIQAGIYTIITSGHRNTLKIVPVQSNDPNEQRGWMISYLFGPNNEGDYRGFCYLMKDGTVRMWNNKISEDEDLKVIRPTLYMAVSAFLSPTEKDVVLESAHCNRCGRRLTVPVSIHNGLGPECAKK